jgi:predicted permease
MAIACLAIGLSSAAVMFGVTDAFFLRAPAGVRDPKTLARFYFDRHLGGKRLTTDLTSYPVYTDIQSRVSRIPIEAYYTTTVSEGSGEQALKLRAGLITPDFLSIIGVKPLVGRGLMPGDGRIGSEPVALISNSFWQVHFGGRANVIGKPLLISGKRYSIVGALPQGFDGIDAEPVDVWLSLENSAADLIMPGYLSFRGAMAISLVGRIPNGNPLPTVESAVTSAFRSSMAEIPTFDSTDHALIAPLWRERGPVRGDQARVSVWLGGVSVVVLLIACLNCAGLLLVRGMRRQQEFAIRVALGAGRSRLVRMVLIESVVLSLVAALAAIIIALVCSRTLRGLLVPSQTATSFVSVPRVFGFTIIAGLLTGTIGNAPVIFQILRQRSTDQLKPGTRAGYAVHSSARMISLVAQVALTTMLLIGAELFVQSLRNAQALDLGFDHRGILAVNTDFAGMTARSSSVAQSVVYQRLEDAIRGLPGVTATAVATSVPFQSLAGTAISIPGRDSASLPKLPVFMTIASRGYQHAIGLRLKAGRWFGIGDYGSGAATAVISETMARTYWPKESAIGKCIIASGPQCRYIIGIVGDARRSNLNEDPRSHLYIPELGLPASLDPFPRTLIIRTAGGNSMPAAVRRAIYASDRSLAYVSIQSLDDLIAPKLLAFRLGAVMMSAFGVVALALALFGLYATISWVVAGRAHEFGVRFALGARRSHVVGLVVTRALGVILAGAALGAAAVFVGASRLDPLLFGVKSFSPSIVLLSTLGLCLAGAGACLIPVQRAANINPVDVLRAA